MSLYIAYIPVLFFKSDYSYRGKNEADIFIENLQANTGDKNQRHKTGFKFPKG
jgi:hypothetical protein